MDDIIIREIHPADNLQIAIIIRESLKEFGANHPGTVFYDDTTDHLYELFHQQDRSVYFVAEKNGVVVGGAGIFPSPGLPQGVCELVKMYLNGQARGLGLGKKLIDLCLEFAASQGYETVYLETMPELKRAVSVYEKFGFEYLPGPMGNTGHYGCDVWMKKNIKKAP